ncbi:indole-3-glycerol phosphate synthase TrpC [Gammaproteobacteria bacterium]|nr:indole-3-glycerol phosphate synthase TrpC [Gammaproteobacteria bacterium]
MVDILEEICNKKRSHIAKQKSKISESNLLKKINKFDKTKGFLNALKRAQLANNFGLVAEIKKASPSKGLIRNDFDPATIARSYKLGGATCLSVLTDKPYFQGADTYLKQARSASDLPALRKDFIIDSYQVIESRVIGADCILIILACVSDADAKSFITIAHELAMDVLIEVHTQEELYRALKLSPALIGINNRNLKTLEVDLKMTEALAPLIDRDILVISESGLYTNKDLLRMKKIGINSFLVGESLMREQDVEKATRHLLGI